jgi:hypothetical protein
MRFQRKDAPFLSMINPVLRRNLADERFTGRVGRASFDGLGNFPVGQSTAGKHEKAGFG